jgi:hypothetical protein
MTTSPAFPRFLLASLASILVACGSSSAPDTTRIASWPESWCRVQLGMTLDQATSIMGEPTQTHPSDAAWKDVPPGSFVAVGTMFIAFLGSDGRIRQLDAEDAALPPGVDPAIACAATRIAP